MTLPVVLAIAGCIALLVGLFGGGVKAKEIEVPKVSVATRIISGLFGVTLIGMATWISYAIPSQPPTTTPEPSITVIPTSVGISSTPVPPTQIPPTPYVLNIRPACGTKYTVEAGKVIELHYGGWYEFGLALARDNINHLTVTLFIDGRKISGTKQEVQQVTSSWYPGASCGSQDYTDAFGTFYIADIGILSAGEHSVQIIYSFDKQVPSIDKGNPVFYGPGDLDPLQFTIVAGP